MAEQQAYRTLRTANGRLVANPNSYILYPRNKTLLVEQIDGLKNSITHKRADWRRNELNRLTKSLADRAFDADNGQRAISPGATFYRVEDWDFDSSIPKAGAEALPHQHLLIQTAMDAHIQYRNDCRVEAAGKKDRKQQKKAAAASTAGPANGAAAPEEAADAASPPARSRPVTPPNDMRPDITYTPPSNAGWSLVTPPFTTPSRNGGSPLQYVTNGLPYPSPMTPPIHPDQIQHPFSVATSVGSGRLLPPPTPITTPTPAELTEISEDEFEQSIKVESGSAEFQQAGLTLEEVSLGLRKARAELAVVEWEQRAQRLQRGEHVAKRRRME